MLAEYKRKTNIGVGLGMGLQIASRALTPQGGGLAPLAIVLVVGGIILFIWGCMSYAKGKGYNGAWGLLGLLSIIGLIILVLMPDKHK
jgi:hypothetical protein